MGDSRGKEESEKALYENKGLISHILDNTPNPIMVISVDHTIMYVNPAFTKLTGFSLTEIIGAKPPFPYWPNRYSKRYSSEYFDSNVTHCERLFQKKNGERFWVELSSNPVVEDGTTKYHIVSWINISEHKRMERAIKEVEWFSSSILSMAPNPILVSNLDTSIEYINPAFEKLTGYKRAELIGRKSPYPWWPPEKLEQFVHEDVIGRQLKSLNRQERYYIKKNGELIWIALSITAIKDKRKTRYYLSNWVDITERKRMEDALKESYEYSSSLLTNSPNPIVVYNPDTSIRYVNPAFERLTGFSARELISVKPPFPWWPEEERQQRNRAFGQGQLTDQARMERVIQNKKGEKFFVEITRSTVRDSEGNRKYLISIWIDTTEQKRLQKNLEFYVDQVTKVQEEERKRIARELHDDTAQTLSILGLEIESAGRNRKLSQEDFPRVMDDFRSKVNRILNDVRRFSHELRPDLLDQLGLIMAVENMVDEMGQAIQKRTVFEALGDERRLSAEMELLIFRIIQESLNNIRKHAQAEEVKVKIKFKTAKVLVMVTDNGIGFEVAKVMNELATRGNMGLLGMQERVRLLGGRLVIKSRPGKGTVVFVSIPEKSHRSDFIGVAASENHGQH